MIKRFEHGGNIYKINREFGISEDKLIDFSANINPLGMSKLGKNAYIDALDMIANYPDPDYVKLKNSIANYHSTSVDNLYIANGAIEMIYKSFEYINAKKALIVAPTFVEYERALNRIDIEPDFYILDESRDFEIDIEILKLHSENYDLIVICSPNNPTGKLFDKKSMIELANYIEGKNLACKLFLDEAFIDFISEEESMIDKIEDYPNLFILRSATKFFAIPGLRMGYLITSNEGIKDYHEKQYIPWSINLVAQEVLIASLQDDEYISETVKTNEESRQHLYEKLSENRNLKLYSSKGSYILFRVLCNIDLKSELLKKSILIRSCSNYIGLDDRYYRIAVKSHEHNSKLIDAINEVFENA